jgi:hypothetical protein
MVAQFGWVGRGFESYRSRNPWRGAFYVWRGPDRVFAEWADAGDIPYAAPAALGAAPSQTGATTTTPQARRSAPRGYPRVLGMRSGR